MHEQTITIGLLFDALKKADKDTKIYYDEYELEEVDFIIRNYVIDTLKYIESFMANSHEVDDLAEVYVDYIFNK